MSCAEVMNSHSGIDPQEATQLLKDILKVGKQQQQDEFAGDCSAVVTNGSMDSAATSHPETMKGSTMGENLLDVLFKTSPQTQDIQLSGDDSDASVGIYSQDVTIYPSPVLPLSGSSKIKIQNMVDFSWEHKYYYGRLLCVHPSGIYLAYAVRVAGNSNGLVRVTNRHNGKRGVVRGLKGQVKDMGFAHISDQIILACVDEVGTLFVSQVTEEDKDIGCQLVLQIDRLPETKPSTYHRLLWCPYIPEELPGIEESSEVIIEDVSQLLMVTHHNEAEIWNVDVVTKEYGKGAHLVDEVKTGLQRIAEHKLPIIDAAFSPDGTALATASLDGEVKFFQVYMQEQDMSPRCLHKWKPHDGKPLSCLFFLDNHKNPKPDVQFWKFAITGASENQELKLWGCETWNCLQTIRFNSSDDSHKVCLKAELDLSSLYLLLSDIHRKVLYVLQIYQDPMSSQAFICSLSKFSLVQSVLSMAIADTSRCKLKSSLESEHEGSCENEEDDEDDDLDVREENGIVDKDTEVTVIKLIWIHSKSLQECRIVFQPVTSMPMHPVGSISTLSQDSFVFKDRLSDLSMDTSETEAKMLANQSGLDGAQLPPGFASSVASMIPLQASLHPSGFHASGQILLTPGDFTSPTHGSTTGTPRSSSFGQSSVPLPSSTSSEDLTLANIPKADDHIKLNFQDIDTPLATSEETVAVRRKSSQRSSASSPSQEVAEILAPAKMLDGGHSEEEEEYLDMANGGMPPGSDGEIHANHIGFSHSQSASRHSEPECNLASTYQSNWPQAPDPSKEYRVVGRHDRPEEQIHLSPESHNVAVQSDVPQIMAADTKAALNKMETFIETLSHTLASVMELLQSHGQDIRKLDQKLQDHEHNQKVVQTLGQQLEKLECNVLSRVEHMQIMTQTGLNKVEMSVTRKDETDMQLVDKQVAAVSQTIASTVNSKLDKAIKNEMKNTVLPHMTKFQESVKDQVQQEVVQRLTATETAVKENITKMVKSKSFVDTVSQAVSLAVHTQVHTSTREVFQNSVAPAIEKVCQNLFLQLNDAFQKGTKEYLQQMDSYLRQQCEQQRGANEHHMKQLQESLSQDKANLEQMIRSSFVSMQEMLQQQIQESLSEQQEALSTRFRTILKEEVQLALREHAGTMTDGSLMSLRSHSVTPVPQPVDREVHQQQIMQLLRQGQLNSAFQQALSASDLKLVLFVCETVSPDKVFSQQPCPLQQPVLLSLIHQLSSDLDSNTELKQRYLQDAVMNLDVTNMITREHMGNVLSSLKHRLTIYTQNNPTNKLCRNMKMLTMAVQSLMNS